MSDPLEVLEPKELIRRYRETGDKIYLHRVYRREAYQKFYQRIRPKWQRKFEILAKVMELQPGDRVLDVGCASQMFRPFVEASGAIYRGLDISEGFEPDYVCDAEDMSCVQETFDWIVMADVLEHLPNPVRALAEARRIGEKVVAVVPNWYRFERFGLLPRHLGDRHITRMNPAGWRAALVQAGWDITFSRGFFPSVP